MGYPGWNKVGRALRFGGSTRGHSTYRHVQKLVVKWKGRFKKIEKELGGGGEGKIWQKMVKNMQTEVYIGLYMTE